MISVVFHIDDRQRVYIREKLSETISSSLWGGVSHDIVDPIKLTALGVAVEVEDATTLQIWGKR